MTNPIRIHDFPISGHAHRVLLFANLANIPHEVVHVDLPSGEHKQAEFLALNPLGQVPVVEDGEVVISDSNAILVYLARKYAPQFLPQDPVLEAEVQRCLSLAAGDVAFGPAAARLITVFNAPLHGESTLTIATRALTKLETLLEGRTFFVGEIPTIADVAIYTYVAHAPEGNVALDNYPNVQRFLSNVEGLPGFIPMPVTKAGLVK